MPVVRLVAALAVAIALVGSPDPAFAEERRSLVSPPRVHFPVLDRRWAQFQSSGDGTERERETLADFHETMLELGLLEMPAHALVLMQQAAAAESSGDRARADQLTDWAEQLAPGSPQPHFFRARQAFNDSRFGLGAVTSHVRAGYRELRTTRAGTAAVGRQWRGIVVVGGLLFSLLFALALAARHGTAVAHDLRLALVKTLTRGQSTALVALLIAAPPLLLWSPLAFIISTLLVCALHMTIRERLVGLLVLALCAAAPILTADEARLIAASDDNASLIVDAVVGPCNQRCVELLELAGERDGRAEASLVLAWNDYKRGTPDRLRRAAELVGGLELKGGVHSSGQVLLGNIAYAEGDFDEADARYREAYDHADNATQRAVAHYALSRVHSAENRPELEQTALLAARAEDGAFVSNYIDYIGRSQNRLLPISPIPPEALSTSGSEERQQETAEGAARQLLRPWFGSIPPSVAPTTAGAAAFLLLVGIAGRRMRLVSRRCTRCATPVSRWVLDQAFRSALCILCFQLERAARHLRREQRGARRERIERWREAAPKLTLAANLLAPGAGLMIAGWTMTGAFFSAVYASALAILLAESVADATPYTLPESALFDGRIAAAVGLLAISFAVTARLSFRAGTPREPTDT